MLTPNHGLKPTAKLLGAFCKAVPRNWSRGILKVDCPAVLAAA